MAEITSADEEERASGRFHVRVVALIARKKDEDPPTRCDARRCCGSSTRIPRGVEFLSLSLSLSLESKEEKRKRPTNFTSLPPFRRFDKGKERREFLSWLNFNRHFRGNPPADVTDLKTKRNVTPAEAFDTQRLSIGRQSRA